MASEDHIIKILVILDKGVGKRTLKKIADKAEYKQYPAWVRQFMSCGCRVAKLSEPSRKSNETS